MILRYIFIIFCFCLHHYSYGDNIPLKKQYWPFEGFLGKVDRKAAQRGFQVYKEVCAACHGLNYISYRKLEDIGFSKEEVKKIASDYEVQDGPNEEGVFFTRPANPNDKFVSPFANEKLARSLNNGAYPVNLSLIVKARKDGANYLYSLLTGYKEPPKNFILDENTYYNPYYPGMKIAMSPPLSYGIVKYQDGTIPSVHQMSRDIVIFLQWAAEPEMEHRKSMGLKVMIYLIFFVAFFYVVNKKLWKKIT